MKFKDEISEYIEILYQTDMKRYGKFYKKYLPIKKHRLDQQTHRLTDEEWFEIYKSEKIHKKLKKLKRKKIKLKYFLLILKHKWFVFIAGLKIKAPIWRLITHDLSKFSPKEFPYYNNRFFGDEKACDEFEKAAWDHHKENNDHHLESWILTPHRFAGKSYKPKTREMSNGAVLEMIADWIAGSRMYEGEWPYDYWPWLDEKLPNILSTVHPSTSKKILEILKVNNLMTLYMRTYIKTMEKK